MSSASRNADRAWVACTRTWLFAATTALFTSACREEARPVGSAHLGVASPPLAVRTSEIVAGPAQPVPMPGNPYAENAYVIAEGRKLYAQFNCAGCHGMKGGGGMGPPLADADWIYGSDPVVIHQSIRQGRPEGMPSFPSMSDEVAWKIVAYVRSLDETLQAGGSVDGTGAVGGPGSDGERAGGGNESGRGR